MTDQPNSGTDQTSSGGDLAGAYWRANLALLAKLLVVWFLVSFGAGILFKDALDAFTLFGFPLGFWFAQQGSIYVFVILIFVYGARMHALEARLGLSDDEEPDSYDLLPDGDGDGGAS